MKSSVIDVDITVEGPVTVVSLRGDLDSRTAVTVQDEVLKVMSSPCMLAIDLTGLRYMSSAGLRVMLLVYRQAQRVGSSVALVGLSDEHRMIMDAAGFLRFFAVTDSATNLQGFFQVSR
ncbi:STAS domain-containing protein [Nonomuraea sp. LPB2021202275-12-8]|uniref:STAS domain-containing protein n=1 Tax=Nonomuraea sp. LPB2021202275-12-8 TaxID=3120159 RepID=UPI00300CA6EA